MAKMSEASLRARAGGHAMWARVKDRTAATEAARAGARRSLDERLAEEFDISPDEPNYGLRMESARKAHFARLALKSAQARRRKAAKK